METKRDKATYSERTFYYYTPNSFHSSSFFLEPVLKAQISKPITIINVNIMLMLDGGALQRCISML